MCAIFGIARADEAANLTYLGLHALQHRGQEGAGIVSTDGISAFPHRRLGQVGKIFRPDVLKLLKGNSAIGHTRYSTTGGNIIANLQPLHMKCGWGWLSVAHNGNLVNAKELSEELEKEGAIFQSTNDTEVIVHLIARSKATNFKDALIEALKRVKGAYSLLVLTKDTLYAVRDPLGFRPLVMGSYGGKTVFASETSALSLIGAEYEREIAPGELVAVDLTSGELTSERPFEVAPKRRCVFEYVYFARPDSNLYGASVYTVRKALGKQLAKEQPAEGADAVIPVPDSGVAAAIGYAEVSGISFDMGIMRSHFIGRTFIEPSQHIRDFGVKLKLNPIVSCIKDRNIVIVDDSLVRGTTSRKLVRHLRDAGAAKVHVRISAPPTTHSCFYGIDTPTRKELLASSNSVEEIRKYIGADSLGYLSLDGLIKVSSEAAGEGFCHACFSGDYPVPVKTS